ncbi:MAG: CinA family protein [Pseudomonadota bacterium]
MSDLVNDLSKLLRKKRWMLATAESCTGGMIAAAITSKDGSSQVFDRGFITYSNEAKMELLGVQDDTLIDHGAVSQETAIEMAKGALDNSKAQISVSVTGIAGPGGGTKEKPVGLVYIGYAIKGGVAQATKHNFDGDREEVRSQTSKAALNHLIKITEESD